MVKARTREIDQKKSQLEENNLKLFNKPTRSTN